MLFEEPAVRDRLSSLVHTLSTDWDLEEDLLQEALIHLWEQQLRTPGQTQSWYLQSCYFYLIDYLNQGRSVDCLKRRHNRCSLADASEFFETSLDSCTAVESVLDSVSARDTADCLAKRANHTEKAILAYLADGLGVGEIGQRFGISHQSREQNTSTNLPPWAMKLGISPLPSRWPTEARIRLRKKV